MLTGKGSEAVATNYSQLAGYMTDPPHLSPRPRRRNRWKTQPRPQAQRKRGNQVQLLYENKAVVIADIQDANMSEVQTIPPQHQLSPVKFQFAPCIGILL